MSQNDKEGGFVSHLAELRKRLIHSFIFLIVFFVGCYFFAEHLYVAKGIKSFKKGMASDAIETDTTKNVSEDQDTNNQDTNKD